MRFPVSVADVRESLPEIPVEEPQDLVGPVMDWIVRGLVQAHRHPLPQAVELGTVGSTALRPGSTVSTTPGAKVLRRSC